MNVSKITNVLIFKDGYYYLTANLEQTIIDTETYQQFGKGARTEMLTPFYHIIEPEDFTRYGIDRNGFEFPGDAYAYIAHLQTQGASELIYNDREEDRLNEMGLV